MLFYSRNSNNKINRLHERALRIVCPDYKSSFRELIEKNHLLIHHKNAQSLSIEIYKFLQNSSPSIINNIFKSQSKYPL